jgi:hypothetical protein
MRVFRVRSGVFTSIVLVWQLVAVIFVPVAACCQQVDRSNVQAQANQTVAECPMHHEEAASDEPSCPLHAAKSPRHECDCPTLGCSQTDKGFMALFGPIGVLPTPSFVAGLHLVGDTATVIAPFTSSLAPVPLAPPPRA